MGPVWAYSAFDCSVTNPYQEECPRRRYLPHLQLTNSNFDLPSNTFTPKHSVQHVRCDSLLQQANQTYRDQAATIKNMDNRVHNTGSSVAKQSKNSNSHHLSPQHHSPPHSDGNIAKQLPNSSNAAHHNLVDNNSSNNAKQPDNNIHHQIALRQQMLHQHNVNGNAAKQPASQSIAQQSLHNGDSAAKQSASQSIAQQSLQKGNGNAKQPSVSNHIAAHQLLLHNNGGNVNQPSKAMALHSPPRYSPLKIV